MSLTLSLDILNGPFHFYVAGFSSFLLSVSFLSTELIFCTSYNLIFTSEGFFLILVFIPSVVFLSVAQDFVVLL